MLSKRLEPKSLAHKELYQATPVSKYKARMYFKIQTL
jgi:hypothetical protein